MFKIAILGFVQVFLVSQQSRNASQARYLQFFLMSLVIGVSWGNLLHEFQGLLNQWNILSYALGSASGGTVGIWFHKRFYPPKDPKEW